MCWHHRHLNGERYFLSKDERDRVLHPFPDEMSSPTIIIEGQAVPPTLQRRHQPDSSPGNLYVLRYSLPTSTVINLRNLNEDFCLNRMALKTGVFGDATTPSGRFGQYLWASPAQCLDYSTVHTQTPYQNESKLLWDTIGAFPDLHIHGEWMRENDQLKNDIIENWFPFYGDGEVTSGTYKRAGHRSISRRWILMSGLLWVVSMQLSRMIECSTHLFQSLRDQMMWNKLTFRTLTRSYLI